MLPGGIRERTLVLSLFFCLKKIKQNQKYHLCVCVCSLASCGTHVEVRGQVVAVSFFHYVGSRDQI